MAATNGKATRATIVKQDKVDQALTFLKELPDKPKEDLSLREAVGHLKDSIRDALTKGYSYADLAKMLTDQGIKISTLTLKNYVPSGKRSGTKTRTRRAKNTQSEDSKDVSTSEIKSDSTTSDVKKPRRRAKSAATETTSADSNSASTPKRSGRGRAKTTTVAKAKTGSRTRATQQSKTSADTTAKAPTKSRRRRTSKEAS